MKILATDLDRTLLPNGKAPDDNMLPHLGELLSTHYITPVFVTARRASNVIHSVFSRYNTPIPAAIIGAVGAEIFINEMGQFTEDLEWYKTIMKASPLWNRDKIEESLAECANLRLQEPSEQTDFKLSFYLDNLLHFESTIASVQRAVFQIAGDSATITASRDLNAEIGYCDITPSSVTKESALKYYLSKRCIPLEKVLYAGDSGNDLPVIISNIDALLVANAEAEVKETALRLKSSGQLIIAGGVNGLNGNYCSGIIEGLIAKEWIPKETGIRN